MALVVLMALSLAACGKKENGTRMFGDTDLSEYVTLGEYKGITVDTGSDGYKTVYEAQLKSDVSNKDLYEKKLEGKVADGDIANIDYVGKKDGVAFQGGTAQGYDLTIGSHTFIDGFESGLIGVEIGSTVDLNLRFPENYKTAELAGQAVVFTVKVNYVKSQSVPTAETVYEQLGFSSAKEYEDDLKKRAAQILLFNGVYKSSEIDDPPAGEKNEFINATYENYDKMYRTNYGKTFKEVLEGRNMTVADFKAQMSVSADSQLQKTMVYYAILQKEGLKAEYELPSGKAVGQPVLDEITKVEYVVKDFLYDNAKIK